MSRGITNRNIDLHRLIEKLHDVLIFLDENNLAIPAIKVEEAINALKMLEMDKPESSRPDWWREKALGHLLFAVALNQIVTNPIEFRKSEKHIPFLADAVRHHIPAHLPA